MKAFVDIQIWAEGCSTSRSSATCGESKWSGRVATITKSQVSLAVHLIKKILAHKEGSLSHGDVSNNAKGLARAPNSTCRFWKRWSLTLTGICPTSGFFKKDTQLNNSANWWRCCHWFFEKCALKSKHQNPDNLLSLQLELALINFNINKQLHVHALSISHTCHSKAYSVLGRLQLQGGCIASLWFTD